MLRMRWIVILVCVLMGCGEDVITGLPCDTAVEAQRCAGDGTLQVCNRETSEWENTVTCAESESCQMVEGVASCVPQTPACTTASDCSLLIVVRSALSYDSAVRFALRKVCS